MKCIAPGLSFVFKPDRLLLVAEGVAIVADRRNHQKVSGILRLELHHQSRCNDGIDAFGRKCPNKAPDAGFHRLDAVVGLEVRVIEREKRGDCDIVEVKGEHGGNLLMMGAISWWFCRYR